MMREREIPVRTDDGDMTTFFVHPEGGGPYPVGLVYMDGVGYREQVKANARRFAKAGYFCIAPDLYYRSGAGIRFDLERMRADGMDSPEGRRMMAIVREVTPARVTADTAALLQVAAGDPAARIGPKGCVGYCLGARVALAVAAALPHEFAAAACIHPGALVTGQPDSPHHDLALVRSELYVAFAEHDRTATPESVEEFRAEMERQGVGGVVERLPGTTHGFAMADLPVYDSTAAERHFERTLDLWGRALS